MDAEIERLRSIYESGYGEPAFLDEILQNNTPMPSAEENIRQFRKQAHVTQTFYSNLLNATATTGFLLFNPMGLSLGGGREIQSCYIENHGTAAMIGAYQGAGVPSNAQPIGLCGFGKFKRFTVPDGTTELTFIASTTDNGLVIVTLSTLTWGPTTGSL